MQLVRASEEHAEESLSSEAYRGVLERMGQIVGQLESDLAGEVLPAETPAAVRNAVDQPRQYAREAIRHYREGLEVLARFAETRDGALMVEGLSLAEKGDGYLRLTAELSAYVQQELEKAARESRPA
jgi:hypothetical protein